jgi:hypothetical protein
MTGSQVLWRVAMLALLSLAGASPASAGQVLVAEPNLTLSQNFLVAATRGPPPGQFMVVQWQPNPLTASGLDVPVTWMMNRYTGFAAPPPFSVSQAGTANRIGSTGMQVSGKTIGINLNSLDVSQNGTTQNLLGIFPAYTFPASQVVLPFAQASKTLVFTMQAQVPTASVTPPPNNPAYSGNAHIGMDMLFRDTIHPATPAITFIVHTFAYGYGTVPAESIGFETAVQNILVNSSLDGGSTYATMLPNSQGFQTQPWTGFRTFTAGITAVNFAAAIKAIQGSTTLLASLALAPGSFSTNPANYSLVQFHINSELNYAGGVTKVYSGGSVQMGLSIRNIQVSLQDANDCTSTHNGVDATLGLENGDQRFLCAKRQWYACGGGLTRAWAIAAAAGQTVAPFMCNGSAWVPAP